MVWEGYDGKGDVEGLDDAEVNEDDTIQHIIVRQTLQDLQKIADNPTSLARLATVEQLILKDLLTDSRPFRCRHCLSWAQALIKKATKTS